MNTKKVPNNLNGEGNLHDLIYEMVEKYEYYCFSKNSTFKERSRMKRLLKDFLQTDNDREREILASMIVTTALRPHAKQEDISNAGSVLTKAELYGNPDVPNNRFHFVHQVYVFLIGLLLYYRIQSIQDVLDNEMNNTTSKLSGGDPWGEFLFRWRLTSLSHDIGNAISLFWDDQNQIEKNLRLFEDSISADWFEENGGNVSIEDLKRFSRGENISDHFERISKNRNLQEFSNYLKSNPYDGIIFDHGIVGSIIISKIIDDIYAPYDYKNEKEIWINNTLISFDRIYFDNSVMRAAYAIAQHNLDFYKKDDSYLKFFVGNKLFDIDEDALTFLLKISDILQEWNKPKISDPTNYYKPNEVKVKISKSYLEIIDHPKKDSFKELLNKYMKHDDTIRFR